MNPRICLEKASRKRKVKAFGAIRAPHCRSKRVAVLDVLAGKDLERLLEGLDLGLPALDALLVAHSRVHAARLELLVVRKRGIQLTLRTLEVLVRRRQLTILARLELLLVVNL